MSSHFFSPRNVSFFLRENLIRARSRLAIFSGISYTRIFFAFVRAWLSEEREGKNARFACGLLSVVDLVRALLTPVNFSLSHIVSMLSVCPSVCLLILMDSLLIDFFSHQRCLSPCFPKECIIYSLCFLSNFNITIFLYSRFIFNIFSQLLD